MPSRPLFIFPMLTIPALLGVAGWWWLRHSPEPTGPATATKSAAPLRSSSHPRANQPISDPRETTVTAPSHAWLDPDQIDALSTALVNWAATDRAAAAAFLSQIPAAARHRCRDDLASSLIATDPAFALGLLDEDPSSAPPPGWVRQAAMEYAATHPDTGLAWALAQPDAEVRAQALSAVLTVLAASQPTTAMQHLHELPAGPLRDRTTVEILQRWVQTDPLAAAGFVTTMKGPLAADAAVSIVPIWAAADHATASRWVEDLADPALRAAATAALPPPPPAPAAQPPQ